MQNILEGIGPRFTNLLVLFTIFTAFLTVYYRYRNSSLADIAIKPLNFFFLILLILGVIPHSEYPPFEYIQQNMIDYGTSIGPTGSLFLANLILTFILIINFISYQDKIDFEMLDRGISKIFVRSYRSSIYSIMIFIGFLSLIMSLFVYGLSIIVRYLVPTSVFSPVGIIMTLIGVSILIFFAFNLFTRRFE